MMAGSKTLSAFFPTLSFVGRRKFDVTHSAMKLAKGIYRYYLQGIFSYTNLYIE